MSKLIYGTLNLVMHLMLPWLTYRSSHSGKYIPSVAKFCSPTTQVVALVKPQFEAGVGGLKHKGVIKNDHMRRDILKAFEQMGCAAVCGSCQS